MPLHRWPLIRSHQTALPLCHWTVYSLCLECPFLFFCCLISYCSVRQTLVSCLTNLLLFLPGPRARPHLLCSQAWPRGWTSPLAHGSFQTWIIKASCTMFLSLFFFPLVKWLDVDVRWHLESPIWRQAWVAEWLHEPQLFQPLSSTESLRE